MVNCPKCRMPAVVYFTRLETDMVTETAVRVTADVGITCPHCNFKLSYVSRKVVDML